MSAWMMGLSTFVAVWSAITSINVSSDNPHGGFILAMLAGLNAGAAVLWSTAS